MIVVLFLHMAATGGWSRILILGIMDSKEFSDLTAETSELYSLHTVSLKLSGKRRNVKREGEFCISLQH